MFSSQSQVMERLKRLLHHITGDTSGQEEPGPAEPNEAPRSSIHDGGDRYCTIFLAIYSWFAH